MNTDHWVNRLAAIPDRIARAVAGESEAALRRAPDSGGWSAAEIFAHVRASDDIQSFRLYALLVRNHSPLPAYDEIPWAVVAGYADADINASLHAFAVHRAEVVGALRRLTIADWGRVGMHEQRGEVSLLHELIYQVEHE
ncbi:MAG: DinB family protein [Anaerolineae bacterium]